MPSTSQYCYCVCVLNTTIALGNGALFAWPPNFNRPRINLTSPNMAYSCHHFVSVRAGTSATTRAPFLNSSTAFFINCQISLPYGGFIKTRSGAQRWVSPSTSRVKKRGHFLLSRVQHGSNVKLNSASNLQNKSSGVDHKSEALEKCIFMELS